MAGVVADNLRLPFANGIADALISDGVIHHTDDPRSAFAENLRILKPGGQMYLGVYKSSGRYPVLYKFPGDMIRRGLEHSWSRPLVVIFARFLILLSISFDRKVSEHGPAREISSTIILLRRALHFSLAR